MQQTRAQSYIKLAVILFVIFIVGLAGWQFYQSKRFYVTSVDPAPGDMTTWSTDFHATFNKPLSKDDLSVTTVPQVMYKNEYSVSGNTLTVELSVPLKADQTYSIIINDITSTSGQRILHKTFTYQPKPISESQIPDDDQETLIERNQKSNVYKDPILAHLPYSTIDFNLTSSFSAGANNTPILTLDAQLLLHAAQAGDPTAVAQDKQEVTDYIQSLGLNPSKYTITYTVQSSD